MIFLCILPFALFLNSLYIAQASFYYDEIKEQHSVYNLENLMAESLVHLHNIHNSDNEQLAVLNSFDIIDLEDGGNSSDKCSLDTIHVLLSLEEMWALKMIDSFGKPDSGFLQGSAKWPGDYAECLSVYAPPVANFTAGDFYGKYCTLAIKIPDFNNAKFEGNHSLRDLAQKSELQKEISVGVCIPNSCGSGNESELSAVMAMFDVATPFGISGFLKNITTLTCESKKTLSGPAIAVIVILSILVSVCVAASCVSVVRYFFPKQETTESSESIFEDSPFSDTSSAEVLVHSKSSKFTNYFLEVLSCFDVFHNGAKILDTSAKGEMLSLHGIRFLSMTWVILGHTYGFCIQDTRNVVEAISRVDNFPFQVVLQGFYSVDSFFVLSGFLLCYLTMKQLSKNKKMPWLYFYVHRYIRLTPIYMIILGFSASVYFYLGSGPFWPANTADVNCEKSWWWNLLYINNFRNMTDQCMGWGWYLANDMQFFVISPLFLITLWKWTYIGYSLVASTICASSITIFILSYKYNLIAGIPAISGLPISNLLIIGYMDYFNILYIKPYARIGPYLIGMLTGYLVFKQAEKPIKLKKYLLLIGWVFFGSLTLTVVYGLYHQHPSLIAASFYNALNRSIFALGLCWVIYVCVTNQGGFVNDILSFGLLIPLSRLTYTAYLIHPMVLTWYAGSLETPFQFSHPILVFFFLGAIVVTYSLSFVVCLLLESPVIALEKLIRTGSTSSSKRIN